MGFQTVNALINALLESDMHGFICLQAWLHKTLSKIEQNVIIC